MKWKMKKVRWIIFLSALSTVQLMAQKVTIDAEYRPRGEYRQGFTKPLADTLKAGAMIQQRTRLGFGYESNGLDAKLTLQDARVFGETDTKSPSSIGVYEAWADLLLFKGTSFKVGRQGVQFEDGRLFSLSPWSNTGTSHDLAQLKYSILGLDAQLGGAYGNKTAVNSESVYDVSKMYKSLWFFHATKSIVNGLDLSVLAVDEGFQQGTSAALLKRLYHRYTTGGTLGLKHDSIPFGFLATAYYQYGSGNYPGASTFVELKAYLLAIKANYKISKNFGVTAGADYFSGSDKDMVTANIETNTFNKLYGVNHSFNGYMEYWATLPKGGLFNYFGGLTAKITEDLSLEGTYYVFRLSEGMKVGANAVPMDLGSELDVVLNYKLSAETAIQAGWCTYFKTKGTDMLKSQVNVETQSPQYAYLMLTIKPKFFTQK